MLLAGLPGSVHLVKSVSSLEGNSKVTSSVKAFCSPGGVRLTSVNERKSPQPEGRASAQKAALNVSVSSTG